ncbi:MAG: hypothetical protein WBD79_07405, partial [Anaerolineae bacterium]
RAGQVTGFPHPAQERTSVEAHPVELTAYGSTSLRVAVPRTFLLHSHYWCQCNCGVIIAERAGFVKPRGLQTDDSRFSAFVAGSGMRW